MPSRRFSLLSGLAALLCAFAPAPAAAGAYGRIAKALTRDLGAWKGRKAAVVPFSDGSGRASAGGTTVAERLQTELAGRGALRLVERSQLRRVLEEIRLRYVGLVAAPPASVGKLAGAELLVTGTVTDAGASAAEIHARLIVVETGEVLRAADGRVRRDWPERDPDLDRPSPPRAGGAILIRVAPAGPSESTRRILGRDLAFRYSFRGQKTVVRMLDFTDTRAPEWAEVELPGDFQQTSCRPFASNFRLRGAKYRAWMHADCNLHVAPRGSLFSEIFLEGVNHGQETVLSQPELLRGWTNDIRENSRDVGGSPGRVVTAYVESLRGLDVQVSLFAGLEAATEGRVPSAVPTDAEVLAGRHGSIVRSRLLRSDSKYFRAYYNADARSVTVEPVGGE